MFLVAAGVTRRVNIIETFLMEEKRAMRKAGKPPRKTNLL
jgi:hypothetical protein